MPLIGIITDFGNKGNHYVGEMKAVAKRIIPDVDFIDITHYIKPFSIIEAAFILFKTYYHYPKGTVFVIVVDPGVGSERDIVAVKTLDGYYMVGPDNGIFSYFALSGLIDLIVSLKDEDFFYNPERVIHESGSVLNPDGSERSKIKKGDSMGSEMPPRLMGLLDAGESYEELLNIIDSNSENPDRNLNPIERSMVNNGRKIGEKERLAPFGDFGSDLNVFGLSDKRHNDLLPTNVRSGKKSRTFQGRDIMMPVAAHIANGVDLFALGDIKPNVAVVENILPESDFKNRSITGIVLHIDSFGNIITNIPQNEPMLGNLPDGYALKLILNDKELPITMADIFSGHSSEELLFLRGSTGFMEIDMNRNNASSFLDIEIGDRFKIKIP